MIGILELVKDLVLLSAGVSILNVAANFWNKTIGIAFTLLGEDIDSFAGGEPIALIDKIQPCFVAIGTTMLVLFFLYGLFESSFEDTRFDMYTIVKSIVSLILAEFLMSNSRMILSGVLSVVGGLMLQISGSSFDGLQLSTSDIFGSMQVWSDANFIEQLIVLILCLITALVMMICAGILVYVVYFRYVKILFALPFAPLAISSMSGPPEIKRTGLQYFKYFIVLALEAVGIMIAILICNALLKGGIPTLENAVLGSMQNASASTLAFTRILLEMFKNIFTCCLTVASAKGSEQLLQKMIG
ncbi:MAG: hypothetical protein J6B50_11855 [Lachnospiraceae bacterium]|nr:hypothetical protein [Lachnospiraceae bacterium]